MKIGQKWSSKQEGVQGVPHKGGQKWSKNATWGPGALPKSGATYFAQFLLWPVLIWPILANMQNSKNTEKQEHKCRNHTEQMKNRTNGRGTNKKVLVFTKNTVCACLGFVVCEFGF